VEGNQPVLTDELHKTHRMERAIFCSYWNKYTRNEFALLLHNASAKTIILGYTKCLFSVLVLSMRLMLYPMKCDSKLILMEFTDFTIFPATLWELATHAQWNGLLRT
jgi:hypothetical protein